MSKFFEVNLYTYFTFKFTFKFKILDKFYFYSKKLIIVLHAYSILFITNFIYTVDILVSVIAYLYNSICCNNFYQYRFLFSLSNYFDVNDRIYKFRMIKARVTLFANKKIMVIYSNIS
jgi:hypothetical protein